MKYTCILSSPTGTASFQMKYGATTAHRAWGVSPFNFLPLKKGNPAVKRLQEMVELGDLAVFDEFSMLGKAFIGKVVYRAREVIAGRGRFVSRLGLHHGWPRGAGYAHR